MVLLSMLPVLLLLLPSCGWWRCFDNARAFSDGKRIFGEHRGRQKRANKAASTHKHKNTVPESPGTLSNQ
jgi:hypothetical protein